MKNLSRVQWVSIGLGALASVGIAARMVAQEPHPHGPRVTQAQIDACRDVLRNALPAWSENREVPTWELYDASNITPSVDADETEVGFIQWDASVGAGDGGVHAFQRAFEGCKWDTVVPYHPYDNDGVPNWVGAVNILRDGAPGPTVDLGSPPPPVNGVPDRAVSVSYEIKNIQLQWANDFLEFLSYGLGLPRGMGRYGYDPNDWTPTNQWFGWQVCPGANNNQRWAFFTFSKTGFGQGDIDYGTPTVISDVEANLAGTQYDLDNRQGLSDDTRTVERKLTLAKSVETNVTRETRFNFSQTAEVTLKGKMIGTEFETKVGIGFEQEFTNSKSQTQAASTSTEQSVNDQYTIPTGEHEMALFSSQANKSLFPFDVNGPIESGIEVRIPYCATVNTPNGWNKWMNPSMGNGLKTEEHHWRMEFDTFQGVNEWIDGTDVTFPSMDGWLDQASADALHWRQQLIDPENRTVSVKGTQVRTSDDGLTVRIINLTKCSDDDVQNIEQQLDESRSATASALADAFDCVDVVGTL